MQTVASWRICAAARTRIPSARRATGRRSPRLFRVMTRSTPRRLISFRSPYRSANARRAELSDVQKSVECFEQMRPHAGWSPTPSRCSRTADRRREARGQSSPTAYAVADVHPHHVQTTLGSPPSAIVPAACSRARAGPGCPDGRGARPAGRSQSEDRSRMVISRPARSAMDSKRSPLRTTMCSRVRWTGTVKATSSFRDSVTVRSAATRSPLPATSAGMQVVPALHFHPVDVEEVLLGKAPNELAVGVGRPGDVAAADARMVPLHDPAGNDDGERSPRRDQLERRARGLLGDFLMRTRVDRGCRPRATPAPSSMATRQGAEADATSHGGASGPDAMAPDEFQCLPNLSCRGHARVHAVHSRSPRQRADGRLTGAAIPHRPSTADAVSGFGAAA